MKRLVQWLSEHRYVLSVILLFGFLGVWIVYRITVPGESAGRQVLLHLALALIVASFVGAFALLHEFHSVFVRHLENALVDQRFFEALDPKKLEDIGAKAFSVSISRSVDNAPDHQWKQMYETVSTEVLPLVRQAHRVDYEEHVSLDFMRLGDVAASLGTVPVNSDKQVCRIETTTIFRVVSPKKRGVSKYPYLYETQLKRIPEVQVEKHFEVTIQKDNEDPVRLEPRCEVFDDVIKVLGGREIPYEGSCRIRIVSTEWEYRPPFILLTMQTLTRDFFISVVSNKRLDFKWSAFTLGGATDTPVIHEHSIELRHRGWLLPEHGAVVYWSPEEA